jgi:hypothetical protein
VSGSQGPGAPDPGEDLEYDLAHDWTAAGAPAVAHVSVYVATQTPDDGGDYGYDMAHDVPGR